MLDHRNSIGDYTAYEDLWRDAMGTFDDVIEVLCHFSIPNLQDPEEEMNEDNWKSYMVTSALRAKPVTPKRGMYYR